MQKEKSPKRILFHYMLGISTGGSDHSLFQHIINLDRSKYEPIVIFNQSSYHRDYLEKLNIKTMVIEISSSSSSVVSNTNQSRRKPNKIFEFFKKTIGREVKALLVSFPEIRILREIFKTHDIDIIHTNFNLSGSRPAIIAAILFRIPIVAHNRGLSNLLKVDRILSLFINKIICISNFVKEEYTAHGIDKNKCKVIFNGVDIEKFSPNSHLSLDKKIVLSIGRLEKWKGQHIIIQAAKELLDIDNVEFWIIGSGSEYDSLKDIIKNNNLEERVKLLGQKSNVNEFLHQSSIFIHSSIDPEPFGRVIIEAMACKVPVIATNIGGPTEIISNNNDGILIPPNSVSELEKSIKYLLQNESKCNELANNARKKVVSSFDIKKTTSEIEKIYSNIQI